MHFTIQWINREGINRVKSARVRALISLHSPTSAHSESSTHQGRTASTPAHHLLLVPSYTALPHSSSLSCDTIPPPVHRYATLRDWSLSFLTHPLRLWYCLRPRGLCLARSATSNFLVGESPTLFQSTACMVAGMCIMHFWLDVVCLSPCIINAQPWRSTLPLNPFNGKGGSQRFCQSLSTLQHCSERVRDFMVLILWIWLSRKLDSYRDFICA